MALVIPFGGACPSVPASAWVAPNATLVGRVTLGERASVFYGAVLRGDMDAISIGDDSNLQDNVTVHVDDGVPATVGARVSVGHAAVLHGCTVEDDCLIGMSATVLNRAVVGAGSLVAAGSVVLEGTVIPPRSLVAGVPAKVRREITDEEFAKIQRNADSYLTLSAAHKLTAGELEEALMSEFHRVVVLVLEGAKPLDVGIPAQVFTHRASMPYEVRVCGAAAGLVTGGDGLSYHVAEGLEALAEADTVFIPGYREPAREDPPAAVVAALLAAHERGARLAAISTGAFALAATGLLNGKRATTHWHYTRTLRERHPEIQVDENVLFVDEGSVLTSAGAASGIDLCLHLVRRDHGVALSNRVARRLVAAPYRSGGQAQFVPRSVPEPLGDFFAATRQWALERLEARLSVEQLARHARVSPRTFSRRFLEDTGYTPMQWVLRARIDVARELLERTDLGVEEIADRVGLGTAANLRMHFHTVLGTSPTEYRSTFSDLG